jgi:hypothetical protein
VNLTASTAASPAISVHETIIAGVDYNYFNESGGKDVDGKTLYIDQLVFNVYASG